MRLVLILFMLGLCSLTAAPAMAAKWNVLVIPKGGMSAFWEDVRRGAEAFAQKRDAEIIFRGPIVDGNQSGQLAMIQKGIDDKVDAIVLAPSHTTLAKPLLEKAVAQGIKVVIIDSDMDFPQRVSLVGTNNQRAGRVAAEYMFSLIGRNRHLLVVRFRENNASTQAREQAFLKRMFELAPSTSVTDTGYVGSTVGEAYHVVLESLKRDGNVSGVFVAADIPAFGVLRAIRELKMAGLVKVVMFDFGKEIYHAFRDGVVQGSVMQVPFDVGYQGVKAAIDALEGKPVPKRIETGTYLLTEENYGTQGRPWESLRE